MYKTLINKKRMQKTPWFHEEQVDVMLNYLPLRDVLTQGIKATVKNKALPDPAGLCTPCLVTLPLSLFLSLPRRLGPIKAGLTCLLSLSCRRRSSRGYPLDPAEAGPRQLGFSGGIIVKESSCQCRRHKRCGFDPWVGKISWSRKWQPVFNILAWEIPWTEEPGVYGPWCHKEPDVIECMCMHSHAHAHTHTMGWPKSSFGFFHKMSQKNLNKIFCQPTSLLIILCNVILLISFITSFTVSNDHSYLHVYFLSVYDLPFSTTCQFFGWQNSACFIHWVPAVLSTFPDPWSILFAEQRNDVMSVKRMHSKKRKAP